MKQLLGKFFVFIFLFGINSVRADEPRNLLGASAVLHRVEELTAKPAPANPTADAQSALRADLKKFAASVSNLPPADAAKGWLELVDRAVKSAGSARGFSPTAMPLNPEDVFEALPPPAMWNELARAIAARPPAKGDALMSDTGLRFLASTLTGNAEARKHLIADLQSKAQDANPQAVYLYQSVLIQINQAVMASSEDPDVVIASLERSLKPTGREGMRQRPLAVPNLVAEVGPEKAEAFLRKALVQPGVALHFQSANDTSRLAQKLALQLIDQLKTPQWNLVNSLDAVDLYEALEKRFPKQTNAPALLSGAPDAEMPDMENLGQKATARAYYLLGLIAKDRSKDAAEVAKKMSGQNGEALPGEAFKAMERAGYTAALDNFFHEMLSQDATLPFWDNYVQLAAKAGTTARMLALARAAAAREDVSDNKKTAIRHVLCDALLAADEVDEGVKEIRLLMATNEPASQQFNFTSSKSQLALKLVQIGFLLHKSEWVDEGIAEIKKSLNSSGDNSFADLYISIYGPLERILFDLNRGKEAEAILTEALANSIRTAKTREEFAGYGMNAHVGILGALATLYHHSGQPQDIVTLLEQSPDWGAKDVSELFSVNFMDGEMLHNLHEPAPLLSIPYLAADALLATGRKQEAGKIIDELLNRKPGSDRGYELLLALKGNDAMAHLDELFARDQFEERPLIWKAHLLRGQNKLPEAEKVIRQAIAIDPSDGEEGRGDRMRAYSELADIREALGEKKDADFYREVVKAIRLSENADEFYRAGLLARAVPMYQEGLNHFADAYCIQSRLALQMSELGKHQEAEEHYRRAYELMPDSFGRVESHCFGCELAFEGERAQSIADKVFTKLVAERPDKPQVHYLLGYLRLEEERYAEAQTNFLAATRLDPSYLNAWIKAGEASQHVVTSPKERDEIVFNVIRLDPLQRHGAHDFRNVSDLAGLWNAMAAAASHQVPVETNLFTLTASKAAMAKTGNKSDQRDTWQSRWENERSKISPGRALLQTPFIQLSGQLIFNGGMGGMID